MAEVHRSKVSNIFRRSSPPESNILPKERTCLKELKEKDIVIVPADKGNWTVVMNVADYEKKGLNVTGKKPFERVLKDPTSNVEDRINKLTYGLFQAGKVKKPLYDELRASLNPLPRFYGRAKVHQVGCPVRRGTSAVGTATYNVSSHIAKILAPLVGKTKKTVKIGSDLVESIVDIEIQDDETMISYDIEALYTSLPIGSVLEIVRQKLEKDETFSNRTTLDEDDIVQLLKYCLTWTYITFRDGFTTSLTA